MINRLKLYQKIAPKVERYIRIKFRSNKDLTDDLLQEALISVWQGLEKFDETREDANLLLWSLRAAKQAALSCIYKESWVPEKELKKQRWLNQLEELVKQFDDGSEESIKYVEQHLAKMNLPLEELVERLENKTEDRLKDLSGLSYKDWVRIQNYSLQGSIQSLYKVLVYGDEEGELQDNIPSKVKDKRLKEVIQNAINQLPTDKQLIVVLHDLLGMTLEEVSLVDSRDRTLGALSIARTKALQELKEILKRDADARNREDGREYPRVQTMQQIFSTLLRD